MILHVPNVLISEQVARCREVIMQSKWVDGRVTAGHQSAVVKNNLQLPEDSTEARELGDMIIAALERHPLFIAAALPYRVFPPIFNRYDVGMSLGTHLDNSVRQIAGTPFRLRTDMAATLFLSQPDEYDGGELVIDDVHGAHAAKLPAGEMALYPATTLHRVTPVTRGTRLASIFWVQSMVRDEKHRRLLFELDMAINQVNQALPNHAAVVALTNCYHNLLRRDADV
jgi:PKHD-type hydroxylase